MLKNIVATAVVAVIGLFFISPSAQAAEPLQLITVTPSSTSLSADPGGSTKGSMDVINTGTSAFTVALSSSPYHVDATTYDPRFTQLPGTVDPSKWVRFATPTSATIEPNKLFTADYVLEVPPGTAPGGYYAVIFAETNTEKSSESGVTSRSRVGNILYITVKGVVKTAGTAQATRLPAVISYTRVELKVTVGNQGGVHFQTTVTTTIKDIFGNTAFTHTAKAYVLPQTQREITTEWSPNRPINIYRIEQGVLLPNGVRDLPQRWVLIVKPWVIIMLIVMIIVLVIVSILGIQNRGKKRRQHDS